MTLDNNDSDNNDKYRMIVINDWIWPKTANIEIRPCLTSTYLSLSNLSWSASVNKPRGSQNPRGGWAPRAE